jgi:thiamine-phosphate pyrophosphorylase
LKVDKHTLLFYAVTDRSNLSGNSLAVQVEAAIRGGVTFVQLREKQLPYADFVSEAQKIKKVTDRYNIPFVINDNIDVALAINADGVHVGQTDLGVSAARTLLGKNKIIGVSAQTIEEARLAEQEGADYLGVGTVFPTATKLDATGVSLETLREICSEAAIPVVAIGGINAENILKLRDTGIDGVAVVSALFAQPDTYGAAKTLAVLASEVVRT